MRELEGNPQTNRLGAGVDEDAVLDAINKSGYPLQTVVSAMLRNGGFDVQEEWSFIDSNSGSLRALDMQAEKRLCEPSRSLRVRPTVNLLVECKQSDLPYVFFSSPDRSVIRTFPVVAGLHQDVINVLTNDDRASWNFGIFGALGLDTHPFVSSATIRCMSFSKAVRASKRLELSGTDAYQNLVLPMVKALQHFKQHEAPPQSAKFFDCHAALAIGILDAPMIVAESIEEQSSMALCPWVRVVRHEAVESEWLHERLNSYAIDVVHKDFFSRFLTEQVLPFANKFGELTVKHAIEIAEGKGFAMNIRSVGPRDIESRLRPRATDRT